MDKTIRILAALDGSAGSESVFNALIPLSHQVRIDFTLLRVAAHPEEVDEALGYLDRLASRLSGLNFTVETRVEQGDPAQVIQHRLHSGAFGAFDFGALATHGRRGLSRLITGSVAEEVLRRADVPLFIHRPDGRLGDWKEIVVALDGSTAAEAVLDPACRIASLTHATLHLVGVAEIPVTTLPVELAYGAVAVPDLGPYLERVKSRLEPQGVKTLVRPLRGMASAAVVRYATDLSAGLICMTTLGRGGLRRVIMGSVAERIMRTSPCPVLVRRTKQEAAPAMTPSLIRKPGRPRIHGISPLPGWARST